MHGIALERNARDTDWLQDEEVAGREGKGGDPSLFASLSHVYHLNVYTVHILLRKTDELMFLRRWGAHNKLKINADLITKIAK